MTGIAWKIAKNEVWLMADTMISDANGQCFGEQSKIFPVLHAQSMICMVGSPYAIGDWLQYLVCAEIVSSLAELNDSARAFFSHLHPERYAKHAISECRLYQFGVEDGLMAGYLLRSPGFVATKVPEVGSDPSLDVMPHIPNLDALKSFMKKLKADHPSRIGCAIHYANLQLNRFRLEVCHEFPDRQNLRKQAAAKNLPTNTATIGKVIERHERYNRTGEWIEI